MDLSDLYLHILYTDSLVQWKAEGKVAVWLRVPISLSRCAAAASAHGFTFHHARDDHTVLSLWLGEGENRLPGFATHQVGVAGRNHRYTVCAQTFMVACSCLLPRSNVLIKGRHRMISWLFVGLSALLL